MEWLALRLTAEGYKVWCDCFKFLDGESYPKDTLNQFCHYLTIVPERDNYAL